MPRARLFAEDSAAMERFFEVPLHEYTASFDDIHLEEASKKDPSNDYHPLPLQSSQLAYSYSTQKRQRLIVWAFKYTVTIISVCFILAIPMQIFRNDHAKSEEPIANRQYQNLVFYLVAWLEVTWCAGCLMDIFILAFPYIFYTAVRFINPSYKKYWKIFRALRKPITLLGAICGAFVGFVTLIKTNEQLAVNSNEAPRSSDWDHTIAEVLQRSTFWVAAYFIEKIIILYISIHYYNISDQGRITHSKEMQRALVTLYEASVYLHPANSPHFIREDSTIGNDYASKSPEEGAHKFLEKIGIYGDENVSFFGDFSMDLSSRFLDASSYTLVERAISNRTSAAALAKRIWTSLVRAGKEVLTAEDIAEALGPLRRVEALECFKILDENDSGDLSLEEMVWTVIEAGRLRQSIYQGMNDINYCINTFDWLGLLIINTVMAFFIAILFIPTIKEIQNTVSFIIIGLSFALGRTFHKFFSGCLFIFFEHPFDIGDRVEIYNRSASNSVSAIVTRQSILYTVFRRIDNGTDIQITNEQLVQNRIENVTRSGLNREQITIFVDIKTSFVDLMFLRNELTAFLKANPRDFLPVLSLSLMSIKDLNRIELQVRVVHKSNWSEETLRATRSNKLMCALLAAARKIPLDKPGGMKLGSEGCPIYQVEMGTGEASARVGAVKKKAAEARIDFVKPAPKEGDGDITEEEAKRKAEEVKKREKEEAGKAKEDAARAGLSSISDLMKAAVSKRKSSKIATGFSRFYS